MFVLNQKPTRLCDGLNRRQVLHIGGLGGLGLNLPALLQAKEQSTGTNQDACFGKAKNIIYLWLQGGPPQHETFDPKPTAPKEIRGAFRPIQTTVPGIQFCELLPRTARIADKLAVIRSISTDDNVHSSSGYRVLTGYQYQGSNARTIQTTDWPYFGSMVKMLQPSTALPGLSTVWIPDIMRLNESVTPAGQTGGFLGRQWDPDRFIGDPAKSGFRIDALKSAIPDLQLERRASLLDRVDQSFLKKHQGKKTGLFEQYQQYAFDILTNKSAHRAFQLDQESDSLRQRYGTRTWGQCLILARRLIEAGVRLVHVNWPRDPGDSAVDNPLWDTHAQNADRLEDVLCPQFDQGFTALIEDLEQRGLLDETLVVAIAEFGRTPKINALAGRDHWGAVFSCAMAGAGIAGGQTYGASDKHGAFPAKDRVDPGDVTATLFHLLGIDPGSHFQDRVGRELRLTEGHPIFPLLGVQPATTQRTKPGGDLSRFGTLDERPILNSDFSDSDHLNPVTFGSRPKGWRADPILPSSANNAFGVSLNDSSGKPRKRHVSIGFQIEQGADGFTIRKGQKALLAQEIRNPRTGRYLFTAKLRTEASSQALWEQLFLKHWVCRLQFFRYSDSTKNPLNSETLQEHLIRFSPEYHSDSPIEQHEMEVLLKPPGPGRNFAIGKGLGIALVLEKTSNPPLMLPQGQAQKGLLHIDQIQLEFKGRFRDENVTV